MKSFLDSTSPVLTPQDIVRAMTGRGEGELSLPSRAIITFSAGDLNAIRRTRGCTLIEPWSSFKQLYRIEGSDTVITRSFIGGPAIAALVEELTAFGVHELIMWGYCGALDDELSVGDILVATGALREDGVSHHYAEEAEPQVESNWLAEWLPVTRPLKFREGVIWSCDAIYRETRAKVARYRDMGIRGVEMEAASFYTVARHKKVKAIVFLVISDLLAGGTWQGGFGTTLLREGSRRLSRFILANAIR